MMQTFLNRKQGHSTAWTSKIAELLGERLMSKASYLGDENCIVALSIHLRKEEAESQVDL